MVNGTNPKRVGEVYGREEQKGLYWSHSLTAIERGIPFIKYLDFQKANWVYP